MAVSRLCCFSSPAHSLRAPRMVALVVIALVTSVSCDSSPPQTCPFLDPSTCWTFLGPDTTRITAIADFDGVIYAGTFDGLRRFDPQNTTWLPAGLAGKTITWIAGSAAAGLWVTVAPHGADTTSAVAYWSADRGATWVARDGGLSALMDYHGIAYAVVLDPVNNAIIQLGHASGVARSTDAGTTWTNTFGTALERGPSMYAIISPRDTATLYAGGRDDVQAALFLRSEDRGATWTSSRPRGLQDAILSIAAHPEDHNRVLAGMRSAVWGTPDAGTVWTQVLTTRRPGWVRAIAFAEAGLFALADEETVEDGLPSSAPGFYLSADAGATWSALPVAAGARGGTALALWRGGTVIGTHAGVWFVQLQ